MTKMIHEKKHKRKSLNKEKCEIVIKINRLKEKYTVIKLFNKILLERNGSLQKRKGE